MTLALHPTAHAGLPDRDAAITATRALLTAIGVHTDLPQTRDTPRRFVDALIELTAGQRLHPDRHLAVTFPAESDDPEMIAVPGIRFTAVCEHHLLPFTGAATVAYIPAVGADIVGLSKLARLVQEYAARPQLQERLGNQIVDAIAGTLDTQGAACLIRAEHCCMTLRGARADGAEMVTSHLRGLFKTDPSARAEFLQLASGAGG